MIDVIHENMKQLPLPPEIIGNPLAGPFIEKVAKVISLYRLIVMIILKDTDTLSSSM